jgi:hypothetical protein
MIEEGREFVRKLTAEEKRKLRGKIEEARFDTTDRVLRKARDLESDLAQSQLSDDKREELRKQLGEYYHQRAKRRADEAARREEREKKADWISLIFDAIFFWFR